MSDASTTTRRLKEACRICHDLAATPSRNASVTGGWEWNRRVRRARREAHVSLASRVPRDVDALTLLLHRSPVAPAEWLWRGGVGRVFGAQSAAARAGTLKYERLSGMLKVGYWGAGTGRTAERLCFFGGEVREGWPGGMLLLSRRV